jgi:flagellar biosynthetic protein FliR
MILNQATALLWLGHFLWPFLRMTGLFLTAPIFGSSMVPSVVKATLAAVYAAALAMWLPNLPAFPGDPATAIYAGITQIAYGALLGLVMDIVILTIASTGEIAGLAMGLSFAELQFRESPGVTPVLYNIMLWAGLMAYLAAGGPVWLFVAIAHSFQAGVGLPGIDSWAAVMALGGTLIGSAVCLAMPVLAVTLCVNLTVGLTTVFSPQMNLLTIGFPLLVLAGLWVMAGSTGYIGHIMAQLMHQGMSLLSNIIAQEP